MGEGAVVANVLAKLGERNEDFAGIGDDLAVRVVPPTRRRAQQWRQIVDFAQTNCVVRRQDALVGKILEKSSNVSAHVELLLPPTAVYPFQVDSLAVSPEFRALKEMHASAFWN